MLDESVKKVIKFANGRYVTSEGNGKHIYGEKRWSEGYQL